MIAVLVVAVAAVLVVLELLALQRIFGESDLPEGIA